MTICGLWHGAAWNFAVWGLYHGLGLTAATGLQRRFRASRQTRHLSSRMAGDDDIRLGRLAAVLLSHRQGAGVDEVVDPMRPRRSSQGFLFGLIALSAVGARVHNGQLAA